jgi:hypothetical protein
MRPVTTREMHRDRHMIWNHDSTIPAECTGCPGCSRVPYPPGGEEAPSLTGWRLAGLSAVIFLLPILTAAAGAGLAGTGGTAQLFGGLLGLAAGIAAARAITRRLRRSEGIGA